MSPQQSLLGALFLSGLVGSLGHCLGMCGPLIMMVGLQIHAAQQRPLPAHLVYHGARIVMYTLLGAAVGALGSFINLSAQLSSLAGGLSLILGLAVALLGLGYLGWLPLARIEGQAGWISAAMQQALKRGGMAGIALLGALTGLLPCCLVYGALLAAGSTAGATSGALGMALFGAGTLPALLLAGLGAWRLSLRARQWLNRAAGLLMALVGLQLAVRGLAELHLAPHLQLGSLVFW